ncbi:hypothetical protein RhiirB3_532211 [Rhizophagus irregularis]|nr:hypothetical protein RhiirB3_532211 [Rhizophagus irregularis]
MNLLVTKLFYFILLFVNPLTVYSYDVISHNETEPGFKIYKVITYRDGIAVIHLIKPINESCIEPRIDLRILHPNGTIDSARVDYPIPEYNFCRGPSEYYYWFDINRSLPRSLYILYLDIASASYYVLFATRTGHVISNTPVAPISIINGTIYADGYLIPHISEEYGFMFVNYETETVMMWKYYNKPDDEGNFSLINEGKHYLQNSFDNYFIFPSIDGNFGIVITNSTDINIKSETNETIDPSKFTSKVYVTFIKPIMNGVDGPFLIYQLTIPHLKVKSFCDPAFTGIGNICILAINRTENENTLEFIKVSFQTSGSVFDMEKLGDKYVNKDIETFNGLFQGGFLMTLLDSQHKTIEGIVLDNDGKYNGTWGFPPDLKISDSIKWSAFRNGTQLLVTFENEMTWKILSTTLPKFFSDGKA